MKKNLSIKPGEVHGLEGIEIGMSPTDVTLIMGSPKTNGPTLQDDGLWQQAMAFDDLFVLFRGSSDSSLTVYRVCLDHPRYYKGVIGVSGADAEDHVIRRLGKPDKVIVADDGLSKFSYYEKYNLMLRFVRARVAAICVGT